MKKCQITDKAFDKIQFCSQFYVMELSPWFAVWMINKGIDLNRVEGKFNEFPVTIIKYKSHFKADSSAICRTLVSCFYL